MDTSFRIFEGAVYHWNVYITRDHDMQFLVSVAQIINLQNEVVVHKRSANFQNTIAMM